MDLDDLGEAGDAALAAGSASFFASVTSIQRSYEWSVANQVRFEITLPVAQNEMRFYPMSPRSLFRGEDLAEV